MEKFKFITDSASDIPAELAEKYNISVIPLGIVIDGKVYYDNVDISRREYIEKLPGYDPIPTTTMPPVALIEEELRKNLDNCEHQIFVTLSSASSGTHNTALMLKEQIEDELGKKSNITILDSLFFSMGYGSAVIEMAKMAEDGAEYDEIIAYFKEVMLKKRAYFYVDDLKHLQKGGRIKAGTALIGSVLGIKPILTVKDGLVESCGKERGKVKALNKIVEMASAEASNPQEQVVWIVNGGSDEDCKLLASKVKEKFDPKEIKECELGCTIATHAGPGLVGFIFSE